MIRAAVIAGSLAILLAGCTQINKIGSQIGIAEDPDAPPDTCGLGKVKRFVGVPASAEVLAEIGIAVGEKNLRVIRPGDAVTMDFREDRINADVGAGGRIERFRCG